MNKINHLNFSLLSMILLLLVSCNTDSSNNPPTNTTTGTISLKINGVVWSGAYASGITANLGGTNVLTVAGQKSESNNSETVSIGILPFAGIGTYTFDGTSVNSKVTVNIGGKGYVSTPLAGGGGGGIGTIKITEYVAPNGITNPGKAIGTFSGTIKSYNSDEEITVTEGKFTAVIVL